MRITLQKYIPYYFSSVLIWGRWYQESKARLRYIHQNTEEYDYLTIPCTPVSGTRVAIYQTKPLGIPLVTWWELARDIYQDDSLGSTLSEAWYDQHIWIFTNSHIKSVINGTYAKVKTINKLNCGTQKSTTVINLHLNGQHRVFVAGNCLFLLWNHIIILKLWPIRWRKSHSRMQSWVKLSDKSLICVSNWNTRLKSKRNVLWNHACLKIEKAFIVFCSENALLCANSQYNDVRC